MLYVVVLQALKIGFIVTSFAELTSSRLAVRDNSVVNPFLCVNRNYTQCFYFGKISGNHL